jgi:hypothetical protein
VYRAIGHLGLKVYSGKMNFLLAEKVIHEPEDIDELQVPEPATDGLLTGLC